MELNYLLEFGGKFLSKTLTFLKTNLCVKVKHKKGLSSLITPFRWKIGLEPMTSATTNQCSKIIKLLQLIFYIVTLREYS